MPGLSFRAVLAAWLPPVGVALRLVGPRPEPWSVADTLLTVKLISYFGLAQSQQDMEKLIIQAIHGGGDVEALLESFERAKAARDRFTDGMK